MKKYIGIIIFLTLFIFSSCGTELYVTNPYYVPHYEYIITVDYSHNRRFIPYTYRRPEFYPIPRYRAHVHRDGYKFNKH